MAKVTQKIRTPKKAKLESTKHEPAVTQVEYGKFQEAFSFFNAELPFGQSLPNYLITMQRRANSGGYFAAERFMSRTDKKTVSELALNPDGFTGKSDEFILSILVHEMAHGWRHAYGQPSRRGYHNKEWSAKMKAIGLYPSSTGMVGGKETGQRMSHYIVPGGAIVRAYAKLKATGFKLHWQSTVRSNNSKAPTSKTKFTCLACGQNVWGKPHSSVICGNCFVSDDELSAAIGDLVLPVMDAASNDVDGTNKMEDNPGAAEMHQ